MDTPWNVGGSLSVTLQLQTQYAAYRVKKILLENVSPERCLFLIQTNNERFPKAIWLQKTSICQKH